jgi:predicted  nucleic acid-binding Zn-ribbon protein
VDLPGRSRRIARRAALTGKEHPLKADPFAQLRLLDVQQLDARIDQLRHQLATLPETSRLQALAAERAEVDGRARDARIEVDDLTLAQKKADADVEQVKARRTRDRDRMDRGLVANPKDLERMQQELVSLDRRISDLEDAELEVMESLEVAQAEQDRLTARLAQIDEEARELTAFRDARAEEIDSAVSAATEERKLTVQGVPADLLALYERVRAQKGGVGAAALRQRQCAGCSLQLTAADLGTIAAAPADEVLRCEECNRILVRTPESGI